MRPRLYIIPRYIAPLKYFEKLIPALSKYFEVIVAPLESGPMVPYCKERGIPVTEELLLPKRRIRIPFISHILDEERFLLLAKMFLERAHPAVLLTETAITQRTRALFSLAQAQGVRTLALQWCQASKATRLVRLSPLNRARRLIARHGGILRTLGRELYFALLRGLLALTNVLTAHRYYRSAMPIHGLGLIEESARAVFVERGFSEDRMHVVGFVDASVVHELRARLQSDAPYRNALLERHNLTEGRTVILVIPTMFHAGGATVAMSKRQQVEYYQKIIADIRGVYSTDEAEILFKVHPRDSVELYQVLTRSGVMLIGNEGNMEELIVLSDLVISHPLTAANFTITISGTAALFINFSEVKYLNEGKELYRLREIIDSHDVFVERLRQFKRKELKLQYERSPISLQSRENIIAFVRGL